MPRLTHAVVSLGALDVRRRPDHRAEMRSQLLLGEVVEIVRHSRDALWAEVVNQADGYRGWVRGWGLLETSRTRAQRWLDKARLRVSAPVALLSAMPGSGAGLGPLFLNSRIIPAGSRAGHRRVELPDGRRGWAASECFAASRGGPPAMVDRIRSLLGVPYLWGGRTPAGFDCSGFVQQVLAEQGIALPRDAHEQFAACEPLEDTSAATPGSLVFFGSPRGPIAHVGLELGGGYFSDARGRVRIASLNPSTVLFDSALARQVRGRGQPPDAPREHR